MLLQGLSTHLWHSPTSKQKMCVQAGDRIFLCPELSHEATPNHEGRRERQSNELASDMGKVKIGGGGVRGQCAVTAKAVADGCWQACLCDLWNYHELAKGETLRNPEK